MFKQKFRNEDAKWPIFVLLALVFVAIYLIYFLSLAFEKPKEYVAPIPTVDIHMNK